MAVDTVCKPGFVRFPGAGREARVLAHLGQPSDHPYALNHPEGFYLKGLWLSLE